MKPVCYIVIGLSVLFGLCNAALAKQGNAGSDNRFSNRTIGISLTKPGNWHFLSIARHYENLKNTRLGSEQFKNMVLKHASAPLVVLTRHREPFNDLNPSLKISFKPLGRLKGIDPKRILFAFATNFRRIFKDFRLVQKPKNTTLSGLRAAYMRVDYTARTRSGLSFPTSSEMWIVPRGDYFFLLGAGTRQDEKTGSRAEIRKIIRSIRIRKK